MKWLRRGEGHARDEMHRHKTQDRWRDGERRGEKGQRTKWLRVQNRRHILFLFFFSVLLRGLSTLLHSVPYGPKDAVWIVLGYLLISLCFSLFNNNRRLLITDCEVWDQWHWKPHSCVSLWKLRFLQVFHRCIHQTRFCLKCRISMVEEISS